MLTYLEVKNYIFIKYLALEFDRRLNIFTGETGAGKSIIVEAISYLAGEKIYNPIVGEYGTKCEIVGVFDLSKLNKKIFEEVFENLDVDLEDEIIVRREIDTQNRSKFFINDKLVSLSLIKNFSDILIDIHGQNEHQKLLNSSFQLFALDEYAGLDEECEEYRRKYILYKQKLREKENLLNEINVNRQRKELLQYQMNEIEQAELNAKDENLEEEFEKAKNAQKILSLCGDIRYNLSEIKQKISLIERQIENFSQLLHENFNFKFDRSYSEIEELESKIEKYKNIFSSYTTEYIDNLVDRVDLIKKLKRKYGNSIEEIKNYYEKIKNELKNVNIQEESLVKLDEEINQLEESLVCLGKKISEIRKKKSKQLIEDINKEFTSLGLQKAKIDIKIETLPMQKENIASFGFDKVEFFVSTNPGSPFLPLKEVVSGGELSRIMLAIKTVLGKKENTPILIFDEIDTGISGPMGFVIGKKLKQLSLKNKQIFCITHLPQIACFADRHFSVKKRQKDKTIISVETLDEKSRTEEIARMLSGAKVDEISLQHAKNLLKEALEIV